MLWEHNHSFYTFLAGEHKKDVDISITRLKLKASMTVFRKSYVSFKAASFWSINFIENVLHSLSLSPSSIVLSENAFQVELIRSVWSYLVPLTNSSAWRPFLSNEICHTSNFRGGIAIISWNKDILSIQLLGCFKYLLEINLNLIRSHIRFDRIVSLALQLKALPDIESIFTYDSIN